MLVALTFMSMEDTAELRCRKLAKEDLRDSRRPKKLLLVPASASSGGSCKRLGRPTLPTLAPGGALSTAHCQS